MKKLISIAGALALAAPAIVVTPVTAQTVTASANADLRCGISTPNTLALGNINDLLGGGTQFFADEVSYDCNTRGDIEVVVERLDYELSGIDGCIDGVDYSLTVAGAAGINLFPDSNDAFTVQTDGDNSEARNIAPTNSNAAGADQISLTFFDFTPSSGVTVCGGSYNGDVTITLTADVSA